MARSARPLLNHPLDQASAFTPEALIAAVRDERGLSAAPVPPVCVLDFDGDLTDWLISTGAVLPCPQWACFHTTMHALEIDGIACAIVPRTIGGPYAVLVAEQLAASGARIIFGLTSAGRVSPSLPVPSLVVASQAIRDEGTSYHYLPPEETITAQPDVVEAILTEVSAIGLPVSAGYSGPPTLHIGRPWNNSNATQRRYSGCRDAGRLAHRLRRCARIPSWRYSTRDERSWAYRRAVR